MDPQVHPNPFHEAASHALQRAIQVASSAVTGAQVLAHLRKAHARMIAERDTQVRRALSAQMQADRAAARAEWAPALDPDWLRQADLARVVQVWGAAMPYADLVGPWHERDAYVAMRRCEQRLRALHPDAMDHYDRLVSQGLGPANAMRDAALYFGGPDARDGPEPPQLTAGAAPGQVAVVQPDGGGQAPAQRARRPWQLDFPVGIRQVVATRASQGRHAATPARRRPRNPGQRL